MRQNQTLYYISSHDFCERNDDVLRHLWGPIFPPAVVKYSSVPEWLANANLLHSQVHHDSKPEVIETSAENEGGPYFKIKATGERITACDVAGFVTPKPVLYLATHANCVAIAKETIIFSGNIGIQRASMQLLYHVLQQRFKEASVNSMFPPIKLSDPNGYYGDLRWVGMD